MSIGNSTKVGISLKRILCRKRSPFANHGLAVHLLRQIFLQKAISEGYLRAEKFSV